MRVYAFTGRKTIVLLLLGACYLTLAGAEIWLFGTQFVCKSTLSQLRGQELTEVEFTQLFQHSMCCLVMQDALPTTCTPSREVYSSMSTLLQQV